MEGLSQARERIIRLIHKVGDSIEEANSEPEARASALRQLSEALLNLSHITDSEG